MKILILLTLLSPVFCQVKFVALRDKDTLTVPGALTLVKNIGELGLNEYLQFIAPVKRILHELIRSSKHLYLEKLTTC